MDGDVHTHPADEQGLDIEERLRAVCGHLNVLNAQLVELAAEALETGAWQVWGVRSLSHWLTWQAGISPHRAQEVVRLAEARTTHPAVMSTFAAGALSVDQGGDGHQGAGLPRRGARRDGHVRHGRSAQGDGAAARPAPPTPTPSAPGPDESLATWFDDDGRYHLRGQLDADHGRIVDAALTEARDALFRAGQTDVTWAEAIVEMAQRSLDAGPRRATRSGSGPTGSSTRATRCRPVDRRAGRARLAARPAPLRRHRPADVHRGRQAGQRRTIAVPGAGAHPADRRATGSQVPGPVVHPDPLAAGPPPGPRRARGSDGHVEPHRHLPADHRRHHRGQLGITGNADDPNGLTSPTPAAGSSTRRPVRGSRRGHRPIRWSRTSTRSGSGSTAGRSCSGIRRPTGHRVGPRREVPGCPGNPVSPA